MLKKFLIVGLFALFIIPTCVMAADFRVSESGSETIARSDNVKNLYAAGNTVNSDADVKGDFVTAGQNLNIDGSVEHSLIAAGSNINIKGDIGTNARLAGGTIFLNGKVGEDLTAAGGSIDLSKDSTINGDLLVAGGNITVDGTINGKAFITGGTVTIKGKINGDVTVRGVDKLNIEDGSVIGGNLTYYSKNDAKIGSGAKIQGSTTHKEISNFNYHKPARLFLGLFTIYTLVGTILVLLALVYIFPKLSKNFVEKSISNFWGNFGLGFLTFIATPIAILVLLFTITGAKILGSAYLFALVLSGIASPLLIGSLIFYWIEKKYQADWRVVIIGTIVWIILSFIPILGWLISALFLLVALGQIVQGMILLEKSQH